MLYMHAKLQVDNSSSSPTVGCNQKELSLSRPERGKALPAQRYLLLPALPAQTEEGLIRPGKHT